MKKVLILSVVSLLLYSCSQTESSDESSNSNSDSEQIEEKSGPDYLGFTSSVGELSSGRAYVFANGDTVENSVIFGSYLEVHIPELSGFSNENNEIKVRTQHVVKSSVGNDTVMYSSFEDNGTLTLIASDSNNFKLVQGFPLGYPAYHHEDGSASKNYTWDIAIKDEMSGDVLEMGTSFKLKGNPAIKMDYSATPFDYKEIALYNQTTNRYVTDDSISAPSLFALEFFGLKDIVNGENGVRLGISLKIKDENDNILVEEADMAEGYTAFKFIEVSKQLSVQFVVPDKELTRKINVAIRVWDKNSYDNLDHYKELKANMDLIIKNFDEL